MPAQKKCLGPQRTITTIRQARLKVNLRYVAGPPPLAYFDENTLVPSKYTSRFFAQARFTTSDLQIEEGAHKLNNQSDAMDVDL